VASCLLPQALGSSILEVKGDAVNAIEGGVGRTDDPAGSGSQVVPDRQFEVAGLNQKWISISPKFGLPVRRGLDVGSVARSVVELFRLPLGSIRRQRGVFDVLQFLQIIHAEMNREGRGNRGPIRGRGLTRRAQR
jgi:hypothetical protein